MNIKNTLALAAVVTVGLALGACSTTLPSPGGATTPPTTTGDATTDKIIGATVKACGFLPTVSTVTGIIASFVPGGAPVNELVTSIARSICGAVAPAKMGARRGAASPTGVVRGVQVEGHFVSQ